MRIETAIGIVTDKRGHYCDVEIEGRIHAGISCWRLDITRGDKVLVEGYRDIFGILITDRVRNLIEEAKG